MNFWLIAAIIIIVIIIAIVYGFTSGAIQRSGLLNKWQKYWREREMIKRLSTNGWKYQYGVPLRRYDQPAGRAAESYWQQLAAKYGYHAFNIHGEFWRHVPPLGPSTGFFDNRGIFVR